MHVLRVDSSPRMEASHSRQLTGYLSEQISECSLTTRDLATSSFPPLAAQDLVDIHASRANNRPSFLEHLTISNQLIDELKTADVLIMGVAMHNFSVPAVLKQWIDYVCRIGQTFHYTEKGPRGLIQIDHAYLVIASGGTPIGSAIDFASGYLQHICRFIGVKQIHLIDACGSKREPEKIIAHGKNQIDQLLDKESPSTGA